MRANGLGPDRMMLSGRLPAQPATVADVHGQAAGEMKEEAEFDPTRTGSRRQ